MRVIVARGCAFRHEHEVIVLLTELIQILNFKDGSC